MKLFMLASPASTHTVKWVNAFIDRGLEVVLFGLVGKVHPDLRPSPKLTIYTMGLDDSVVTYSGSFMKKAWHYMMAVPRLRAVIRKHRPDILHAHMASSYGFLGAMSGFHPFALSIWGSEILVLPRQFFLYRMMMKFNISRADELMATSPVMAETAGRYSGKPVRVTPFGVDTAHFRPLEVEGLWAKGDIVVGTVKMMEPTYGLEYLVRAFAVVKKRHSGLPLKLLIVGEGSQGKYLKDLCAELGIVSDSLFTGLVPYSQVPRYLNMLDVYAAPSLSESFGVAVLEAQACELPVIVSNVGGLPDVVCKDEAGFLVEPKDVTALAAAIERCVLDEALRVRMGKAGRAFVQRHYDWNRNVDEMLEVYRRLCRMRPAA